MFSPFREDFIGKWDICFTSRFTYSLVCCLSERCDDSEFKCDNLNPVLLSVFLLFSLPQLPPSQISQTQFSFMPFPEISHSTFHSCFTNYSQLPNPLSSFDSRWHLSLSQLLKTGVIPNILGWYVHKQLLPFPQFVMVVIFCPCRLCRSTSLGLASSCYCVPLLCPQSAQC